MASSIEASCPKCRQGLRIPADWVGRTVRCKGCVQTLQARPRAGTAPPAPAADPFTSDTLSDLDPFAVSPMVTRRANYPRGRRSKSGRIAAGVVVALVGARVAGGAATPPYLATGPCPGAAAPKSPAPAGAGPPPATEPGKVPFLPAAAGPYPRRVLAVSVSN